MWTSFALHSTPQSVEKQHFDTHKWHFFTLHIIFGKRLLIFCHFDRFAKQSDSSKYACIKIQENWRRHRPSLMDQINWPLYHFSAKIDCKDQNGYASIKPDIGAAGAVGGGWGAGVGAGAGAVRPGVSSPDTMARYTPGSSAVDSMARDRTAWMNTCSSLSAAAQVKNSIKQYFWDLFSYKYLEVLPQIIFLSFFFLLSLFLFKVSKLRQPLSLQ